MQKPCPSVRAARPATTGIGRQNTAFVQTLRETVTIVSSADVEPEDLGEDVIHVDTRTPNVSVQFILGNDGQIRRIENRM